MSPVDDVFEAQLAQLERDGLLRTRRVVQGPQGPELDVDGKRVLSFASNDYLGLADHTALVQAAIDTATRHGVGAGASALISGHHAEHAALEAELAQRVGRPRALHFGSGYLANIGTVPALVGVGDAVFSDRLNHACLIDGARLSRAAIHVYPHAEVAALDAQLAASPARRKLILTDGVFSMDGDVAPLPALVEVAERHDALVLVDDAHGFGVLGPDGAGTLAHFGVDCPRVLQMGTLGKAAGVHGAFVAGPDAVIRWLAQRARSYVFATATPPMLAAALRASLRVMRDEPWRRTHVMALGVRLRDGLARTSAGGLGQWLPSASAIHALVLGDNAVAMATMRALWDRGLWVPAIRPPTVPAGTARLRVSLTAAHTEAHVDTLIDALAAVLPRTRKAA